MRASGQAALGLCDRVIVRIQPAVGGQPATALPAPFQHAIIRHTVGRAAVRILQWENDCARRAGISSSPRPDAFQSPAGTWQADVSQTRDERRHGVRKSSGWLIPSARPGGGIAGGLVDDFDLLVAKYGWLLSQPSEQCARCGEDGYI